MRNRVTGNMLAVQGSVAYMLQEFCDPFFKIITGRPQLHERFFQAITCCIGIGVVSEQFVGPLIKLAGAHSLIHFLPDLLLHFIYLKLRGARLQQRSSEPVSIKNGFLTVVFY
ncbi:hypothetical protein FQZ97_994410 [compost metagenome]